ncbi:MAG: SDR family oxidoreductase [Alphaproteobacteria bacterium]|jgi:NAD(P)-dependent dehydrogenase (short-subunit alcohol dehydrogenase family)|nr:SDR family oxidoreductase [Alphaproteobacteria bacterium]
MSICLITGTSTGIGLATALHMARNGHKVHATMRNTAKAGELSAAIEAEELPIAVRAMDVTSAHSITTCVADVLAEDGRIDILVNNAGLSNSCPAEIYPEDEHRALFETNYWGVVRLTEAVLPGMRAQASGVIVNLSSIAGRVAILNQAAYCASKFAVEAYSESLAQEVAAFGIRIALIEPGFIRTAITENTPVHYDKASPYKHVMRRSGRFFARGTPIATPPEAVATVILEAATTDQPRLRYPVGQGSQIIERRSRMSDEAFVALGALDDEAYYARLSDAIGVDLT